MAEKGFGVKEIKFVGSSPKIESLSNLDLSATTVAISTNATVGGNLTVSGNVSIGGTLTYEDVTNIDSVGIITARKNIQVGGAGEITGTPYSYFYGRGSGAAGVSVYAAESALELVGSNDGSHASSLLFRTAANDGIGFNYNPGGNTLELKSFDASSNNFTIHASGNNVSNLKDILKAVSGGAVELYHNGSKKLETNSGGIKVDGDIRVGNGSGLSIKNDSASETLATFNNNGTVQLFYDNSQKLGTAGWGVQINGILKVLDSTDSSGTTNNLTVGTGSDLKLFHDATHSYIVNNTGQLSIENSGGNISVKATDSNGDFILRVGGSTSSENAIVAVHNGEVILSFNGNTKLTTTNSGVTVTGAVIADAFSLGDSETMTFGASNDLSIQHNGSHSYIADVGTGDLRITGSAVHIQNAAQSENMIKCFENGSVELYYDNVKKAYTQNNGFYVTDTGQAAMSRVLSPTGYAARFDLTSDAGASHEDNYRIEVGTDQLLKIQGKPSGSYTTFVQINQSGHVLPGTDSTRDLGSNTVRWRNVYADTLYGSGANLTNLPAPTPATTDIQVVYEVTASGSSAYLFSGNGVSGSNNEDLYLIRGQKYRFINNSGGSHPFEIRSSSGGSAYNTGVTNNGAASGNIDFAPTFDSPDQLYYQCTSHGGMVGNIYLRSAAGAYGPAFRAYLSTYQVLSNATSSVIIFQSDSGTLGFDTDSCYNTSNGRFTPNRAGYYLIKGQLQFSQSTGNYRYRTRLYKNGSDFCDNQSWNDGSNSELHNPVSTIVSANGSSDYFQIVGEQHSGGNITITASNSTFFEAHFIRPL